MLSDCFFVLKIFNVHARVELQYIPNTVLIMGI